MARISRRSATGAGVSDGRGSAAHSRTYSYCQREIMQVADTRRAADPVQITSRAPARAPAEGIGEMAVSESRASTGDGWPFPEHHAYSSIDRAFKANLAR